MNRGEAPRQDNSGKVAVAIGAGIALMFIVTVCAGCGFLFFGLNMWDAWMGI